MGRADFLLLGDWNVVCYQCGFKRKASQMEKHWQGYYVCPEHNEPRQTQDFVRAIPDNQTVPWAQPVPGITYTFTNEVIGFTDQVTTQFQLGDGLYATTVTAGSVKINGTVVSFTDNGKGLITISSSLTLQNHLVVTASGSETIGVLAPTIIHYNRQHIGVTDGTTFIYQLGSGLYPVVVTEAYADLIVTPYTTNSTGRITFSYPGTAGVFAIPGFEVVASGTETIPP